VSEHRSSSTPAQNHTAGVGVSNFVGTHELGFVGREKFARDFVATMRTHVHDEVERLVQTANEHADLYWSILKEARSNPAEHDPCSIGTRVRLKDLTLSAEWYRNRFSRDSHGATRMYSEYIRKGTGSRYSMTAFKREPLWARQVIEMVENRYANLRQRSEVLGKINRALNEYEKLLDNF